MLRSDEEPPLFGATSVRNVDEGIETLVAVVVLGRNPPTAASSGTTAGSTLTPSSRTGVLKLGVAVKDVLLLLPLPPDAILHVAASVGGAFTKRSIVPKPSRRVWSAVGAKRVSLMRHLRSTDARTHSEVTTWKGLELRSLTHTKEERRQRHHQCSGNGNGNKAVEMAVERKWH